MVYVTHLTVITPEGTRKMELISSFTGEYRFLSNFYPAPVPYDGQMWRTAEHAFQAMKEHSEVYQDKIRLLATPGEAKRAGQLATLRPGWERDKKLVMLEIVTAKFRYANVLRSLLAATGDATLIEGNTWHDNYWGICQCGGNGNCAPPGLNALGTILEAVRFAIS